MFSSLPLISDVVICTPGRMLDHLRNSHSVSIDELDVLVLDEVDRLLDLGENFVLCVVWCQCKMKSLPELKLYCSESCASSMILSGS